MTFKLKGQMSSNFDGLLLIDNSDGDTYLMKLVKQGFYDLYRPGTNEIRYKDQDHKSIKEMIMRPSSSWVLKRP